jgi:S1-C subfamily serine protease
MRKLLAIIVLGLLLVGCATGGVPRSSYDPTYSISEAIEDHFTPKRKLEKIEGVWVRQGDGFTFTIYKSNGNFDLKVIVPDNYSYAKEVLGTFTKNSNSSYTGNRNITYNGVKSSSTSVMTIVGDQVNENNVSNWGTANIKYFRKWPKNLASYNSQKSEVVAKKPKSKTSQSSGKGASGSAFFISSNYLITNNHVIEGCDNNSKIIYQTKEIDAQLIAKDKFLDLALLKVNINNDVYISISNEPPSKLQRIIVAGYPFGKYLSDDMKFTSGIISSLKGLGDDSTRLQIDAALNPGNSGGPIIDENTGELVAVAVAGLSKAKTEAVNFGIKAGSVKNFLEANQIDTTFFKKKYSRAGVAKLLESATMYTFCN